MSLVSIVVPVYHNAGSLPDLMAAFRALAERNAGDQFEFLFVEDGSRDNSFAVLEEIVRNDARARIIKLSRNFGSTAALLAGLDQAQGEAVAVISADLQDPPELLDELLARWRQGRKVVLAARSGRDDPGLTPVMANMFYALFRRFALPVMPKKGFDFFLIDRQVCDLLKGMEECNTYLMGLVLWLGFDPEVVHYHRRERAAQYGRSMWTLARKLKHFIDAFVAFSNAPVMASSILGMFLGVSGFVYACVVLLVCVFTSSRPEGWASLMVVTLLLSGAQLLMLGVLGEYLWRSLEVSRRRPRFVIEKTVEHKAAQVLPSNKAA